MVSNIPKPILKNQISLLAHSGQIEPPPLFKNIMRIKIAQKVAIPHPPTALSIMQIELVVGQFVTAQKFISHSSFGLSERLLIVEAKCGTSLLV